MIDFHSHILPEVDDGSKSLDMSLDMLRLSETEGTKYLCATSHYIPSEITIGRNDYDIKFKTLRDLVEKENINVKLIPGLELYMDIELPRLYTNRLIWGINHTKYLLVEFPMQQLPIYTEDVLYELRLLGAVPIIAHPERNFCIMKNYKLLMSLIQQGCLAQVNAGSFRGIYGREIKSFAEQLVKMNLVHLLGSDAHENKKRTTKIKSSFETIKMINPQLHDWIQENQYRIIEGKEVEILPVKTSKKRFSFFRLSK